MKRTHILVLNAGSSSLKFGLFKRQAAELGPLRLFAGQIERIGHLARFSAGSNKEGLVVDSQVIEQISSHGEALMFLLEWLSNNGHPVTSLNGVGHRIVHGGPDFTHPVIVTKKIQIELEKLNPLAPHHMPHNMGAINSLVNKMPDLPQIACFDTAFHATLPELETRLSLPQKYWDRGIRRYGFHGLNYQHVLHELPRISGEPLPERLLIAHLGNGASMCAVRKGQSISTSMGFSTIDGLIMGTRSGSMDPGVLLHLIREDGCDLDGLEDLLYNKSGLLGLSGISGDMRELIEEGSREANFAIEKYCYTAAQQASALISTLGGADAIIFTGGIGENAPKVRASILRHLKWLGISYDNNANQTNQPTFNDDNSSMKLWIIPANEEQMIARQTFTLLN